MNDPAPDAPARHADVSQALRRLLATTHEVEASLARRLGLGVTDVVALQHLVGGEPLGPVDLGHALRIRSASATALVDRLEGAGHLRRVRHPTDGRRVVLELTDTARAEVLDALRPLIAAVDVVTDGFTDDERRAVALFLHRATGALTAFADPVRDGSPRTGAGAQAMFEKFAYGPPSREAQGRSGR